MRMRLFHARYTSGAVVVTTSTTSAGRNSASAKRRSCCASVDTLKTSPLRKQRPSVVAIRHWIPAFAGMTCSSLQYLLDAHLRLVERFLGLLLADQRGLNGGGHGVADRGPLRHARPPVDVGVLL